MPLEAFGGFAAAIPAPLGIGKVELRDGTEVPGFVCEAYAAEGAEDVTALCAGAKWCLYRRWKGSLLSSLRVIPA